MNMDESFKSIAISGDVGDRKKIIELCKQKGKKSLPKTHVREHLVKNFMDSCIYNEKNKKKREIFKRTGFEEHYLDKEYHGLRTAIFWLGYTWEQIEEIEQVAKRMAHKYYPEKPDNIEGLEDTSVWKSKLTYKRSDRLSKGEKFRWFISDEAGGYIFDRIKDRRLYAFDLDGEFHHWYHYERSMVYVEEIQVPSGSVQND